MFVSKRGNEIWLIDQYDHSKQCGEVARYWGNETFTKPSESSITAVEKHDIGWIEPDTAVLFDEEAGSPINFINIDVNQHVKFYSKGYKKVLDEDPYAGMLVGMHWIGLYTSRFGYDPTFTYKVPEDLKAFMQNLVVETQKEWVDVKMDLWKQDVKRSQFEDQIWMDYEFLQFMDRMSQVVSLNAQEEKMDVKLGPVRKTLDSEGIHLNLHLPGDGSVTVDPFPFAEEFVTSIRIRRVPNKKYESHQAFLKELENAPYELVDWKIKRSTNQNTGEEVLSGATEQS